MPRCGAGESNGQGSSNTVERKKVPVGKNQTLLCLGASFFGWNHANACRPSASKKHEGLIAPCVCAHVHVSFVCAAQSMVEVLAAEPAVNLTFSATQDHTLRPWPPPLTAQGMVEVLAAEPAAEDVMRSMGVSLISTNATLGWL